MSFRDSSLRGGPGSRKTGYRIDAPAPPSQREHGPEGIVAPPEVVVERCGSMQGDQAEEQESDRLVRLQEHFRELTVPADHRRQVAEEEQVQPVAVRVGVEEPEDRLAQQ